VSGIAVRAAVLGGDSDKDESDVGSSGGDS
jgi:hypothetical protein